MYCPPACRYKYMHGTDGDFHNPFDKGWRRNCGDTCKPQGAATAPYVLRCAGGAAAGVCVGGVHDGLKRCLFICQVPASK
jgi:hypothetical protein